MLNLLWLIDPYLHRFRRSNGVSKTHLFISVGSMGDSVSCTRTHHHGIVLGWLVMVDWLVIRFGSAVGKFSSASFFRFGRSIISDRSLKL